MSISKFVAGVGLALVLVLSGCGGPDNENGDEDKGTPLKMTVGKHILTKSSSTREDIEQISAQQNVTLVKINLSGTISLSGGDDKNLFELKEVSGGKMLAFRTVPNPYEPQDANKDGVYKVNITGTAGEESITYKAAYRIPIPTSARDVLMGQTLYLDPISDDNNYSKITFNDTSFSTTKYYYDEDTAEIKNSATTTTDIRYVDNYFTYQDDGTEIKCTLKDEYDKRFSCQKGSSISERVYLTRVPAFVIPSNYTVAATADNIHNNSYEDAPKITSFELTGNKANENEKAQIYNTRLNGSFSMTVKLENEMFVRKIITQVDDGNMSLVHDTGSSFSDTYSYSCFFEGLNNNGNVQYLCKEIQINNTEGTADTNLEVIACDDTNLSNPDTHCSWASIPVLFVDE